MAEEEVTTASRYNSDFFNSGAGALGSIGKVIGGLEKRKSIKSSIHDIDRQRANVMEQARRDTENIDQRAQHQSGAQRAAFGAAGLDMVGTPMGVVAGDLFEAAKVRSEVMQNAYRTDAELARAKRKLRRARKMNSFSTAIDIASATFQVAGMFATGGATAAAPEGGA